MNHDIALNMEKLQLPPEHIDKAVANFTKRLTVCRLLLTVTLSICSNSVHLQVCILISA